MPVPGSDKGFSEGSGMEIKINTYDECADQYAQLIADESEDPAFSLYHTLIAPKMWEFLGDVAGLNVLDAGCGKGRLARELCRKGATVTGIDVSPELIEYARARSGGLDIDFSVADLSESLPVELKGKYDVIVANLVIDDVPGYEGFIANLGWLAKQRGKIVLSRNNPYSAVIRGKVDNYFDSGKGVLYQGLSSSGVKVYYFQRTLEECLAKFAKAGFVLSRLSDLKPDLELIESGPKEGRDIYIRYFRFPVLMVLEFVRGFG